MTGSRPQVSAAGDHELLSRIAASLAAGDQKFDEVFRRLDRAEEIAGEARDASREIITRLEAQNMALRVEEIRSEGKGQVAALREDVVAANLSLRKEHGALAERVGALENLRTQGAGAVKGFTLAVRVGSLIAAAGGGAALIKLLEMVK